MAESRPLPLVRCAQGPDGISFLACWYRIPGINDFWICSKCFQDNLAQTTFAGFFEVFEDQPLPGTANVCDFNSARAKFLVQVASRTSNLRILTEFAQRRSTIPACRGIHGVSDGLGVSWFSSPDIPNLISCEACREDLLGATPFASRFRPYQTQPVSHGTWTCDIALPFVKRRLFQCADRNDWLSFVNSCAYRMSLPSCSPQSTYQNSRKWFLPTHPTPIHEMLICEACFIDHFGCTSQANNFTKLRISPHEQLKQSVCTFQTPAIRTLNWLLEKGHDLTATKYNDWHNLAFNITISPSCVAAGIPNGNWYTLHDPHNPSQPIDSNFELCEGCFTAYGRAAGLTHYFQRKVYPQDTIRVCNFCPSINRAKKYKAKWIQAVMTINPDALLNYIRLMSSVEDCPRDTSVANKSWWGTDTFLFCRECYIDVGRNTALEPHFTYSKYVFPSACCDMYTDNMRRRYVLACRNKATGFDEFLAYTIQRAEVHSNYRQSQEQRAEMQRAVANANVSNTLANGVGVTMAVQGSGVGSMDWTFAQNRMLQGHMDAMLRRKLANQKSPEEIEVERRWREME